MTTHYMHAGYETFYQALMDGRLKLGQTLTQNELCAVLGISMSPLREALTLLQDDGLISPRRRLGLEIFTPDVEFIASTTQFRELIEVQGLERFMEAVPADWVPSMRNHAC